MNTGKLNEFTEDGSRTVIYCSHNQLTPMFSKIISRTDVCHADHKSTRVPPPPVLRGCSPCVHFSRGVSIYITYLCESVSYWHFQISTLSVSLDRYRAFVDHCTSYIFWKVLPLTNSFHPSISKVYFAKCNFASSNKASAFSGLCLLTYVLEWIWKKNHQNRGNLVVVAKQGHG